MSLRLMQIKSIISMGAQPRSEVSLNQDVENSWLLLVDDLLEDVSILNYQLNRKINKLKADIRDEN